VQGRIRLIGVVDNTGIGTHIRNLLANLKNITEIKDAVEFVSRNDFAGLSDSVARSTEHDINIFFLDEEVTSKRRGINIIWYVFDLTKIPELEVTSLISKYQEIWVPSEWGRQILLQHFVPFSKIRVMPEGVDAQLYFPNPSIPSKPNSRFRLLQIGKFETRKSYAESVAAVNLAFGGRDDVEFVVKCDWIRGSSGSMAHPSASPLFQTCRVPTVMASGDISEIEMASLYRSADAFLFPSKGEGWGLPLIEAIACGIPCITTCYSGQSEFLNHLEGLFLSVDFQLAPMDCLETKQRLPRADGEWGLWACPDINDFALKLQDSKDQMAKWKDSAISASEIVRQLFSWQACANRVHTAIRSLTLLD
jgi:glycosyltransferase involved in cell wall biosynthesis